jgi:uncharacterized membrane protein
MSAAKTHKRTYFKPIILILSGLGILLSIYLTYNYYSGSQAAFCGAGSECDMVRESGFSSFLGIPVALVGVLGYSLIFISAVIPMTKRNKWLTLYILTFTGFVFSAYLTYLEFFVIDALCVYCMVSAILMTGLFIILLAGKPELYSGLSAFKTLALSAIIAVAVVFGSTVIQGENAGMYGDIQSGSANDFQTGLAKYLRKTGVVMYGSFKCPHCNEQKKLFGPAFKYIRYVECHPEGENANPSLCLAKGIMNYPTWEIGGRYYEGAMTLEKISEISGYNGDR